MARKPRPKKEVIPKTITLHHWHEDTDVKGATVVTRADLPNMTPVLLSLVEFNHVVFTCSRFGIPLIDKNPNAGEAAGAKR